MIYGGKNFFLVELLKKKGGHDLCWECYKMVLVASKPSGGALVNTKCSGRTIKVLSSIRLCFGGTSCGT